jgi:hypothetical protein
VGVAQRTATGREVYVDNLKVVLITAIIVIHAVLGYAGLVEAWTYTELREVTLSPVTEFLVFIVAAPFGFFLIGLLFLVAGLFTAPSLERKGVAAYTRDRVLRLGVPLCGVRAGRAAHLALRGLDLPAEVKALAVAVGGVVGSYALAHLLITRVPGAGRIL